MTEGGCTREGIRGEEMIDEERRGEMIDEERKGEAR